MKGLPNDVKKYFSWESGTLYPDYNDILSQKNNVIRTLNKFGLNSRDSTMKHNNPNNSSSKAEAIN